MRTREHTIGVRARRMLVDGIDTQLGQQSSTAPWSWEWERWARRG